MQGGWVDKKREARELLRSSTVDRRCVDSGRCAAVKTIFFDILYYPIKILLHVLPNDSGHGIYNSRMYLHTIF